ncbi:hypothetical protein FACS1894200_08330 [Spirochaetia bacterium]|nr:hypothetical protein FACS1894200_08330 [Spirochaetia bacterium]
MKDNFAGIAQAFRSLPDTFDVKAQIEECDNYIKQCEESKKKEEFKFEVRNGVLIKYHGSDGDVSIPDSLGITSIGRGVFSGRRFLTSVNIPSGVTTIGEGAFHGCEYLRSVSIPSGVTTIGEWAFAFCRSLTSVSIPSSVTTIGEKAFSYCGSLYSVKIPSSVTTIGKDAFAPWMKVKHGGICFITTAVCGAFNKPDDCYELTQFRAFRDNWLAHQPGGSAIIRRYYDIAPRIVASINAAPNARYIYTAIQRDYLADCLAFIEQGRLDECKAKYTEMVENLEREWLAGHGEESVPNR